MSDSLETPKLSVESYDALPWQGAPAEIGDCVQFVCLDPNEPLHADVIAERERMHPNLDEKTGGIRVLVRNLAEWSNGRMGRVLAFTAPEWEAFTLGVKDGEFDLPDPQVQ